MSWELFVSLRYLRSRRNERFVSVITGISASSVLLGVMVLTIVLSVMTGFEEDLRALEKAAFSPRFEDGKPVATKGYRFVEYWNEPASAAAGGADGDPSAE